MATATSAKGGGPRASGGGGGHAGPGCCCSSVSVSFLLPPLSVGVEWNGLDWGAAAVEQPNRRRRSEVEAEANRRAASSVALSIHPFWELGLVLTPEPFLEEVFSTSCLSSE